MLDAVYPAINTMPQPPINWAAHQALEDRKLALEIEELEREAKKVAVECNEVGQFHLIGGVSEARVHNLIAQIEEYRLKFPGGPVNILMNSMGGNVLDGLALCDYLELISAAGNHTTVVGTGMVASMAGVILQAADERVLTKRAFIGIHEVSTVVEGSITVAEDSMKFAKELQDKLVDLLCDRSEFTPTKLKNIWRRKDTQFSAEAALKHGLIDRIEGA